MKLLGVHMGLDDVNYFTKLNREMIRGRIFCADGVFRQGTVILEDSKIVGVDFTLVDLGVFSGLSKYIIPSLVDIHLHGAAGVEGCTASLDDLIKMDRYERESGIGAYCLASMTLPFGDIDKMCKILDKAMKTDAIKGLRGIYLEGPFISKDKCGAQNKKNVKDTTDSNIDKFIRIIEKYDCIKYVVLAPELSGVERLIHRLREKGIKVSLGHTNASYKSAMAGFEAGASQVTHLYNAMTTFNHRDPGVVGAAFDKAEYVELITDGYHIDPSVVRSSFTMFGEERMILVSDSTMATGLGDGEYMLGDQKVTVSDRKAVLTDYEYSVLAGSASNLYECMVSAIKMGVPAREAIMAATINPAKSLGIDDLYGSIEKGKSPGFILADPDWNIIDVVY